MTKCFYPRYQAPKTGERGAYVWVHKWTSEAVTWHIVDLVIEEGLWEKHQLRMHV